MTKITITADTTAAELREMLGQNYGACRDLIADRGEHEIELDRDASDPADVIDILFMPAINRAAIDNNGGTHWTDATSIADAIRRYRDNDMSN